MDFSGAFSWMNIRFLLEGLKVTVEVSLFSIIFSFLIGGLTGVIRFANIPFFSKILGVVIDIIRNLPLLLIIFFTYFALPQIGIQMNIFWSAVAALTIFESAMLSEIFRAGLNAVPKGQMEAGLSTGLTYVESMRTIVLLMNRCMPAMSVKACLMLRWRAKSSHPRPRIKFTLLLKKLTKVQAF